mmetsp:Transcript_49305/g.106797  ORF Transcript_49305/g.106797 Transcript_49305/m.106797 type:complete len:501 (-) Transcript_49305:303-1805(-)
MTEVLTCTEAPGHALALMVGFRQTELTDSDMDVEGLQCKLSRSCTSVCDLRSHHLYEHHDDEALLRRLRMEVELGRGAYGVVYRVVDEASGHRYALKCISKGRVRESACTRVNRERETLLATDHAFIVRALAFHQSSLHLFIRFELVEGGELTSLLSRVGRVSEDAAAFYGASVAHALGHLHSLRIAYRDLKPENLIRDAQGYLKLVDMGMCKRLAPNELTRTVCGTVHYLAPEVVSGSGHGCAVDWWALGVFLFEVLAGHPPFDGDSPVEVMAKIMARPRRVAYPPSLSGDATTTIKRLLVSAPNKRLRATTAAAESDHAAKAAATKADAHANTAANAISNCNSRGHSIEGDASADANSSSTAGNVHAGGESAGAAANAAATSAASLSAASSSAASSSAVSSIAASLSAASLSAASSSAAGCDDGGCCGDSHAVLASPLFASIDPAALLRRALEAPYMPIEKSRCIDDEAGGEAECAEEWEDSWRHFSPCIDDDDFRGF